MYFNPLSIIVSTVGLYLMFRLRFFFIFHPIKTIKKISGALKDRTAFRSLTLALAGTLGVGNIFGVCVGLLLGGPGSVFWMLISSFFAMTLKYSEVSLCRSFPVRSANGTQGTMAHCIETTLGKVGAPLSKVYAFSTLALALTMGSSLQLMSVTGVYSELFNTPPTILIVLFLFFVAFAVFGGADIIKKITAVIIPLTTIIYIILSVSIIAIHSVRLPSVVLLILDDAFSFDSVSGGILGFLLTGPVREGYSRGILSNEAGAGTSSTAHADSSILSPSASGLMGIVEVFFDTVLLCTLTGLSVLLCVPDLSEFDGAMSLVFTAFSGTFGSYGSFTLFFCVFFFAYSTVVCWYYYGIRASEFLFGKTNRLIYTFVFLLLLPLGVLVGEAFMVTVTDLLLLILTSICSLTLVKNSDRVVALSESGGIIKKNIKGNGFLTKG